jgi:hypothetical protein
MARSRWIARHDTGSWLIYLVSIAIGLGVFASGILLDTALGIENRQILYSDVFTGCMAAVLAFFAVLYYARERRAAIDRLRVAADVNHHVRNALTSVLYSVHVSHDFALMKVTQDAVDRIDWALREILWDSDQDPTRALPQERLRRRSA